MSDRRQNKERRQCIILNGRRSGCDDQRKIIKSEGKVLICKPFDAPYRPGAAHRSSGGECREPRYNGRRCGRDRRVE